MKKSFLLFSSIVAGLLLILISCTKEKVSKAKSNVTESTPGYTDTPYSRNFNPGTPYLKDYPVSASVVDTPYGRKHGK